MSKEDNITNILVYSPYGYLKIDKKDFENNNNAMHFKKEDGTLYGSINVFIFL